MRDNDVDDPRPPSLDAARALLPGMRTRRRLTSVPVAVEPAGELPPRVRYQWDADTEILAVSVVDRRGGGAAAGAVQLEGKDGSWVTLELRAGRFCGLEVAVWPELRVRTRLDPPAVAEVGHVALPQLAATGGVSDLEVDTTLAADADRAGRTFHLTVGGTRRAHAVKVGRDILLEIDDVGDLAGLWLLNVPQLPLPS